MRTTAPRLMSVSRPAQRVRAGYERLAGTGTEDAADGTAGTGLGLAIMESIVDLHHGRVRVESVEGAGTTFFVELPPGDR